MASEYPKSQRRTDLSTLLETGSIGVDWYHTVRHAADFGTCITVHLLVVVTSLERCKRANVPIDIGEAEVEWFFSSLSFVSQAFDIRADLLFSKVG